MAEEFLAARRRTVTWQDPLATAAALQAMSGAERVQAWGRGELPLPPVAALVGWTVRTVEEGQAVLELQPAEYHYNPFGTMHGGLLCSLFDEAMALAISSQLPAGVGATTLDLKATFLRPIRVATGAIRCEAESITVGGRVATAQARVVDADGRLYGHATSTWLVLRPEG